ncbi:MAG: glycosyltransferase family 4 protein [Anaerolineae bacterium]|nr:glycosyltransferase family 4 protein [Anaerolineae bacterium]
MKVLHVVHSYAPAIGGTQLMVQRVSERLAADYGDQVTVMTTVAYGNDYFWDPRQPAMAPGVEEIDGVTVRRFPVFNRLAWLRLNAARVAHKLRLPGEDWLRGLYFGPIVPGMTRAVAASGADVVMASAFPLLHMHYALWGGERANMPTVLFGALHPADRWCFDRPMIYDAIRRCSAYVADSEFERQHLVGRGIDAAKIDVVGVGVDPAPYRAADGAPARQRYGLGDGPVVAIVAQHLPHKRIDLLVAAMPAVWQRLPTARLLVAGRRTDYSLQLEREIARLPPDQQERIVLVSDFPAEEKAELFAACDVLVLPSSHEAFGIVFVEAWAAGKPVIGSRIGAIPTVIDEGVDGLLVRYGDAGDLARAIAELLADPERRARMGEAGRQKVLRRYTWDVITRRFRDVYLQAIRSG